VLLVLVCLTESATNTKIGRWLKAAPKKVGTDDISDNEEEEDDEQEEEEY